LFRVLRKSSRFALKATPPFRHLRSSFFSLATSSDRASSAKARRRPVSDGEGRGRVEGSGEAPVEERLLAAGLKTEARIKAMRENTYSNLNQASRSGPTINFRSRMMDRGEYGEGGVGDRLHDYADEYRARREERVKMGVRSEKATMRGPKITKKAQALKGRGDVSQALYDQRAPYQGVTHQRRTRDAGAWQGAGAR